MEYESFAKVGRHIQGSSLQQCIGKEFLDNHPNSSKVDVCFSKSNYTGQYKVCAEITHYILYPTKDETYIVSDIQTMCGLKIIFVEPQKTLGGVHYVKIQFCILENEFVDYDGNCTYMHELYSTISDNSINMLSNEKVSLTFKNKMKCIAKDIKRHAVA